MSLVHCPECSSQVSSNALMCVSCGFPISKLKALCVAILLKDAQMVSDLIQMGVDVNGIDEIGRTPLMIAEATKNIQIVQILVDAGAIQAPSIEEQTQPILITLANDEANQLPEPTEVVEAHVEQQPTQNEVQELPKEQLPEPAAIEPAAVEPAAVEPAAVEPAVVEQVVEPTIEQPAVEKVVVKKKVKGKKFDPVLIPQDPDELNYEQLLERQEADALGIGNLGQKELDGLSCLQCGGSIQPDDISCRHCKTLIIRRYCSHCSQLIPDHATTCPLCGKNVREHFLYSKLRRAKIFIGIALAALLSMLLIILVLQKPDTQQSSAYQVAQKPAEVQLETNLPEPSEPVSESEPIKPESLKPKIEVPFTTTPQSPKKVEELPALELPMIIEQQMQNPPMSASTQRVLELNAKQRIKRGRFLNSKGFALIKEGRPSEAIPLLEQSIRSFPEGTKDVTYAYALFNLGVAYRMAGRPDIAIPILKERIKIDNQREVVQRELMVARRQAFKSGLIQNEYD